MAEFKYRKKRKNLKNQTNVVNNDYREIALTKMGKRQLTLTLLSIFAVTMVSIGTTFAMFTVSSKSAEYNVVKTGTLTIDFSSSSSTIGLSGALPMSDSDGLAQTGNTFTITNTGTLPASYTVSFQDDNDMITQDECADKQLDKSFIKYSIDNVTVALLSNSVETSLITGTLEAGEVKTFTLKLWIKEDATNDALGKHYHGKIVVNALQENVPLRGTAKEMIATANSESLDYASATDAQKKQMWTFSHDATEQTTALTDYRYIGAAPNNYVIFNNELWRIIGVFDVDDGTGNVEKRFKIIRDDSIGNYSWDNKDTSTGAELDYGKNEWSDARLNYLLNEGHESETYGGSLYWNRKSGTCYSGQNNATASCDFTSTGLMSEAQTMIGDAKWYLGGSSTYNDVTSTMFYTRERGTTVYSGRNTYWTGKVGLMYPSDYGYATSGGSSTNRTSCISTILYNWNNYDDCYSNNWLYLLGYNQWTITPRSDNSTNVFYVNNKTVGTNNTYPSDLTIRPVVYLKSSVKITSGNGTKYSPYALSGNYDNIN